MQNNMRFSDYIKILNNLDPKLIEYFKNAEITSHGKENVQSEAYYRIVLCRDPIATALDERLMLRESLTRKCRELLELHPPVLKLQYMPSEMHYHIENDICILLGNGCMVTNGSPVILASRITRSLMNNAIVIYQSPEWRTDRSLEKIILNDCKDRIVQNVDLNSELTRVFSGIHLSSGLMKLTSESVIEADTYDSIDFEHERIRDKGYASANEYATMLKNVAKREFDSGFRMLFADCKDVLMEYSVEVCFTGCFVAVECYKIVSIDFEEKIGRVAKNSANRITALNSIIDRTTQRDKELKELEKLVSTSLQELKERIETQWRKIKW